jgi:hypothetical protein
MAEKSKNRKPPPRSGGNKDAILNLFRRAEGLPPIDPVAMVGPLDQYTAAGFLPKGITSISEVAVAARDHYQGTGNATETSLTPSDIATATGRNYNSTRRDVRELVRDGLLTVEDGRYRIPDASGEESDDEEAPDLTREGACALATVGA